jgi:hypothetical protein
MIVVDVDRLAGSMPQHGWLAIAFRRISIVSPQFSRARLCCAPLRRLCRAAAGNAPRRCRTAGGQVARLIEEQLALRGYRTEEQVRVTVSVAVLIRRWIDSTIRADQIVRLAEDAVRRAKDAGRNRVELAEIGGGTIPRAERPRSQMT